MTMADVILNTISDELKAKVVELYEQEYSFAYIDDKLSFKPGIAVLVMNEQIKIQDKKNDKDNFASAKNEKKNVDLELSRKRDNQAKSRANISSKQAGKTISKAVSTLQKVRGI